jgi:catechol 2,3-dioxygenase-like lactoylglutathione lyase family enzyme
MSDRGRAAGLAFALLVLVVCPGLPGARAKTVVLPSVAAVTAVSLTVSDMPGALRFFRDVLDFQLVGTRELRGGVLEQLYAIGSARLQIATLRLGNEHIELVAWHSPRGRPVPAGSRSHDAWFQHIAIVVSDMEAAFGRLQRHRVTGISPAPQRLPEWNPAAGGIEAYYFQDRDGHALEILKFPPGKGAARWQRTDHLFLGIDHTAIVVRDTDDSVRFYRDGLGLRIAGESDNHGVEQERLNNVPGAHLRITTLRAASGPGVELLHYRHPRDGNAAPDIRPNDLAYWQTIATADVDRATLLRDPDGHVLQLRPGRP